MLQNKIGWVSFCGDGVESSDSSADFLVDCNLCGRLIHILQQRKGNKLLQKFRNSVIPYKYCDSTS